MRIDDALPQEPWTGETDSRQDGEACARGVLAEFRADVEHVTVTLAGNDEITIDFALGFVQTIGAETWWMGRRCVSFRNVEACSGWTMLRGMFSGYAGELRSALTEGPMRGLSGCANPTAAAAHLRALRAAEKLRKEGGA